MKNQDLCYSNKNNKLLFIILFSMLLINTKAQTNKKAQNKSIQSQLNTPNRNLLVESGTNQEISDKQRDEIKQNWINNHQNEYIQMGGKIKENKVDEKRKIKALGDAVISEERMPEYEPLPQYADFPKYYNTGNKSADDAKYNTEKNKWIEQNKAIYNSLNQLDKNNSSKGRVKANQTN